MADGHADTASTEAIGGAAGGGGGGMLDLEKELSCSICTDILHQPLTLLDCLHTFCGHCLKEWFAWQAISYRSNPSSTSGRKLYTCPSCREAVRGTKADWRLATLLEGFLRSNPGKGKSKEEKEELRRGYVPGEDILPKIEVRRRDEGDSEDERLVQRVRETSLAERNTNTEAARRRDRRRRAEQGQQGQDIEDERQVEHQPSLRSLLGSETNSVDVQQEILASIYAEGLLDGIDVDNLTPQQEEELTERIAEAYRRRQRMRMRERSRRRGDSPTGAAVPAGSGRSSVNDAARPTSRPSGIESSHTQQQLQSRTTRPPISRPHLFDQTRYSEPRTTTRRHARSASSTSQSTEARSISASQNTTPPAARSATDLSTTDPVRRPTDPDRARPRAVSTNATRSATDPQEMRDHVDRVRGQMGATLSPDSANNSPRERTFDRTLTEQTPEQRQQNQNQALHGSAESRSSNTTATPPTSASSACKSPPSVTCTRCARPNIQLDLHYTCSQCPASLDASSSKKSADDVFALCLQCYRSGAGCHHWFGFGYAAHHRWIRSDAQWNGRPHILAPQKWLPAAASMPAQPSPSPSSASARLPTTDRHLANETEPTLLTGAFCDICTSSANGTYWYCQICADGSWGYCHSCVVRGQYCTHPLLPLAHISASHPTTDPSRRQFVDIPHLKEHSWVFLEVGVDCDWCHRAILPPSTASFGTGVGGEWYHCYFCNGGDYDICVDCYDHYDRGRGGAQNSRDRAWRRCERGHRMVVLGTQAINGDRASRGWMRIVRREMVGGWRLKEDDSTNYTTTTVPPDGGLGHRYLAIYARFPGEEVGDELTFPRNAEIREVEEVTEEWAVGVFAGRVRLFPRNHCRRL